MSKSSKKKNKSTTPRLSGVEQPYVPTGNDLFDNPMVRAAKNALSEEDKEKYKIIGEHLYGRMDFESGESTDSVPPPILDALAYITNELKAGLHPSFMEEDEKALLQNAYGDEWYKKWGYIKEDLENIVTFLNVEL